MAMSGFASPSSAIKSTFSIAISRLVGTSNSSRKSTLAPVVAPPLFRKTASALLLRENLSHMPIRNCHAPGADHPGGSGIGQRGVIYSCVVTPQIRAARELVAHLRKKHIRNQDGGFDGLRR